MTIQLEVRRAAHTVPSYSLTGDLLSYRRCARQYRYYNGSSLPPSRPVQMWYGEFVHGVLEACFRYWRETAPRPAFPWPSTMREWQQPDPTWSDNDIGRFADKVERSLAAQGKSPRSRSTRESAYERIKYAVNVLGPELFPLISAAEEKVIGTRDISFASPPPDPRSPVYEVHGVIDVVSHVELTKVSASNSIRRAVELTIGKLPESFEVIIDYKGARRPRKGDRYWEEQDWQVQTYAWLRQNERIHHECVAAIVIYVNELMPGQDDFADLKVACSKKQTDVMPDPGSTDEQTIRLWARGLATNTLSLEYRLRRALRVIPITPESREAAAKNFDRVVGEIETLVDAEARDGSIDRHWVGNCKSESDCAACDFRHSCLTPAPKARTSVLAPFAP